MSDGITDMMREQERKQLIIGFGVVAPTISKQLTDQQFLFDEKKIKQCEQLRESMLHLYLNGILNDKEYSSTRHKLLTRIKRGLIKNKK